MSDLNPEEEHKVRYASEVIAELEKKIDTLLTVVSNIEASIRILDMNYKITSNKLNSIIESINKTPTQSQVLSASTSNVTPKLTQSPKAAVILAEDFTQVSEVSTTKRKTKEEKVLDSNKSIAVQQKVVRMVDGKLKPEFLANVEIKDLNNKVVKITKTNSNGVWNEVLPHGKYIINIKKVGNAVSEPLDINQKIEVSGNSNLQLEQLVYTPKS